MRVKDFLGFRFGKTHTSDLNLEVVSSSNKYENRVLPNPNDYVSDVPGSDGQYYFGSVYKNREFTCNVAFDKVSEQDFRKIRQVFATDKLQDLVFDEEPYKTWKAKLKSKPEFKSLCFTDDDGKRVYKGEGKLVFICYYPYAFGVDKYIVRAADYYMLTPPQCIIQESYTDETFVKANKNKDFIQLPEDTKYHYNVNPSDYEGGDKAENIFTNKYRDKSHRNKLGRQWEPNDKMPWQTGFPTPEQVQAGELFFDTEQGEKTIVDVRTYWDNIPQWQDTAKLLTTPTLDFEQELMYLPQYSKTDFINMEIGFMNTRPMIGTRLLVYNPGDLPVDWELRFDENKRSFWSCRGGTNFRISRFNVERLEIGDAVDWCGLTTYDYRDDDPFKYGNKYFMRRTVDKDQLIYALETSVDEYPKIYKPYEETGPRHELYTKEELIAKVKEGIIPCDKKWDEFNYPYSSTKTLGEMTEGERLNFTTLDADKVAFNLHISDEWANFLRVNNLISLGEVHPKHCYYVEPIPREKLGHYIRLFYWQTIQWRGDLLPNNEWMAQDRYKELAKDIIGPDGKIKDMKSPLVNFLKLFAYVSTDGTITTINNEKFREVYKNLDFERGIEFANRYEESFANCIDEQEEYELYWETLKMLLAEFSPMIIQTLNDQVKAQLIVDYDIDTEIEKFIDSYINHPSEFINTDMRELNYDDQIFNGYKLPEWIASDYIEIDQNLLSGVSTVKAFLDAVGEGYDKIFTGKRRQYTEADRNKLLKLGVYAKLITTLDNTIGVGGYLNDLLDDYYYVNSEERMLYTTANPYGMEFVYKPNKVIMNDAIVKGHWFKIPPGWSLICIEPLVDESLWGGKRWEDARPYDWGYGGDLNRNKREVQQLYDFVYNVAKKEFFDIYNINDVYNIVGSDHIEAPEEASEDELYDELLKFKVWYEKQLNFFNINKQQEPNELKNYFADSLYRKYKNDGEYTLLKTIHSIWLALSQYYKWTSMKGVWTDPDTGLDPQLEDYDVSGYPLRCINGDISDWWWYACNYLWANFPPLYWAVADMLNKIKIKYTPLYY